MNASDFSDFLTFLFNAIALSFITVATIDFFTGIVQLWQTCAIPAEQPDLRFHLESKTASEPPAPAVEPVPDPELPTVPLSLEEVLQGVDIDTLQLRPARKIAKALSIAQKVNGRDQPLSWLRAQIKARLQQPQEVPAEALKAVRDLLAS